MLIAQITDPHISLPGAQLYGGYLPEFAFSDVIAAVAALDPAPDFVWLTGDLTENGTAEEYTNFQRQVAPLRLPTAAVPGNHDRRAPFAAALAATPIRVGAGPFLNLAVDDLPVRMLGLDSLDEGRASGLLCPERLAWLEARLAEAPDRPTLVFLHHPPFETGIAAADLTRCVGGDALAAIVRRYPCVEFVSSGHLHRATATAFGGTRAGTCPSVAWAVPLDLSPAAPPRLTPQNPAFQLHRWEDGKGLVTHTEFLSGD